MRNWSSDRLGAVDRNVMRFALYEMLQDETPPVVALTKQFILQKICNSQSGRFVNGVLDQICKELERPARTRTNRM